MKRKYIISQNTLNSRYQVFLDEDYPYGDGLWVADFKYANDANRFIRMMNKRVTNND